MKCYSPKPESKYRLTLYQDWHGLNPGGSPYVWNALWLAFPEVDALLNPETDPAQWFENFPSERLGTFRGVLNRSNRALSEVMGDSPTQFVQAFIDHFDLPDRVGDSRYDWQQTYADMWERAYQAEGMSEVYEAAKTNANVILADFTLKRRVFERYKP